MLEVLIALAIFVGSLIPLRLLVSVGSDRALDVQQQAQASLLCQSKLAELMTGAEPLASTGFTPFRDPFPTSNNIVWQYKIDATEGDAPNLWNVNVCVQLERGDGRIIDASIAQMVFDPSKRGSTLDVGPASNSAPSSNSSNDPAAAPSSDSPKSGIGGGGGMGGPKSGGGTPGGGKTGGGKTGGQKSGSGTPGGTKGAKGGKS